MGRPKNHVVVSVVVPVWNAENYLQMTLESIFTQDLGEDRIQIILIDDGSTDGSPHIIKDLGDRVNPVFLENSGGPSRPRNKGIEMANGEFVAFFDSDDLMDPQKLSVAIEVFNRNPEVDIVFTGFRSIDMNGAVIKSDYLEGYVEFRKDLQSTAWQGAWLLPGEAAFKQLLRANFIGTSSVVCRRRIFQGVGGFDEEMKNADDIDMWLRIARSGHVFAFVDRPLHSYRINPDGVSARGSGRFPSVMRGLEKQLQYCRDREDRDFVNEQIRRLHLAQAWALRQGGEYHAAIEKYREGLAMGWDARGFLGLLKTRLLSKLSSN